MTEVALKGELDRVYNYLSESIDVERDEQGDVMLPLDWGSPLYVVGPEQMKLRED